MTQAKSDSDLTLRTPQLPDGKAVHELIRRCPPLDLNSSYNYFLLCSHFADTCVVGEKDGVIASFLSAYVPPHRPDTIFVWQVAVDETLRGHGAASRMLDALLARPACEGVRYLETTISPSNTPSRTLFARFAQKRDLTITDEVFISREQFGGEDHEEEILYRIGPFAEKK